MNGVMLPGVTRVCNRCGSSINAFVVFLAVIFGILSLATLALFLLLCDETDSSHRRLPEDELNSRREARKKAWRYMWLFLGIMTCSGITASVIPERQTVLLIAASEMGERVLNHPRVDQVVDPGIELLTTWMRTETEKLRASTNSNNRAR